MAGEHQDPGAPFEQRDIQPHFQRLDLPADGGLGQVQFGPGPGETEIARNRLEPFDQVERRHILGPVTHSWYAWFAFQIIV
jgi:hypothetical protein